MTWKDSHTITIEHRSIPWLQDSIAIFTIKSSPYRNNPSSLSRFILTAPPQTASSTWRNDRCNRWYYYKSCWINKNLYDRWCSRVWAHRNWYQHNFLQRPVHYARKGNNARRRATQIASVQRIKDPRHNNEDWRLNAKVQIQIRLLSLS